jgi:hypothetical protein
MEQLTCLRVTGKGLADVMGQSRPKWGVRPTSAFPPIATELRTSLEVRLVPETDIDSGRAKGAKAVAFYGADAA